MKTMSTPTVTTSLTLRFFLHFCSIVGKFTCLLFSVVLEKKTMEYSWTDPAKMLLKTTCVKFSLNSLGKCLDFRGGSMDLETIKKR